MTDVKYGNLMMEVRYGTLVMDIRFVKMLALAQTQNTSPKEKPLQKSFTKFDLRTHTKPPTQHKLL